MALRWACLLAVGWLAATVSGALGFGGALLLLPVMVATVGGKAAVPILTVAQLMGNASRAGFGRREIRWRPALLFSVGAVPGAVFGSLLFVDLPPALVQRVVGVLLLCVVALRHTPAGRHPFPERWLAPAGLVVGLVSGVAGSAGPLGAAVFLGRKLPPRAYVASEAVSAVLMHLTKCLVYGRYAVLSPSDLCGGLALGLAMVVGSWTGRKFLGGMPEKGFGVLVEILLVASALALLIGH